MELATRKILDRSFTALACLSILFMGLVVLILIVPILWRGSDAFWFQGTVEQRRLEYAQFKRGRGRDLEGELAAVRAARQPVFDLVVRYRQEIEGEVASARRCFARGKEALPAENAGQAEIIARMIGDAVDLHKQELRESIRHRQEDLQKKDAPIHFLRGEIDAAEKSLALLDAERQTLLAKGRDAVLDRLDPVAAAQFEGTLIQVEKQLTAPLDRLGVVEELLRELLGALPGDPDPVLMRQAYGQTRWDRALVKLHELQFREEWVRTTDGAQAGLTKRLVPRREEFAGTSFTAFFELMSEENARQMLRPQPTFYWRFLFDDSYDSHLFGGIWPELLGTFYLTLGAMLFAVPMGIIAAIYLAEYARDTALVSILRSCISTLAGVPSIVFGLFGLAFFINTVRVSDSKSVLAGALTLALLILPTIIRASEEAILAVPLAYKEAAMGLGASHGYTILTVILPAALPGILTGIVISMGRAAGETAPIIFTAAVSMGLPLGLTEVFSQPTPALPWNIYNLCSESEVVDEIVHVQFGMVLTLVGLVLLLNAAAIVFRARIQRKLRG